jgi:hypothetical protein
VWPRARALLLLYAEAHPDLVFAMLEEKRTLSKHEMHAKTLSQLTSVKASMVCFSFPFLFM